MPRLAGLVLLLALLVALPATPVGLVGRVEGPGGPVAGAVVRVKGTTTVTRTDASGRFTLPHPPRPARLTAAAPGFFIAGGRAGAALRLRPLPVEDHEGYAFVDPAPLAGDEQRCGNCHGAIYSEWASSGHSRSVISRHFLNLYDGSDWRGRPGKGWNLLGERPDGSGVCASCHAPTVRDDDEALHDLRRATGVAARGVHCDYCHKVQGQGDGEIGLTHGRFLLKLLRPREGQLFFGPLDDVDRDEDAHSPFYRDSRYCAACHEGVVFGVRVYSTYSEWRQSPAARAGLHCQDCHMKPTGRLTNVAPGRGGIERDPATLGNHRFWDGSQLAMLRRALRLDVRRRGERVETRLVADDVGHRVPTGFIDRQVLLVVEAVDERGKPVALRAGPTLPAAAGTGLAGKPGRLYARLLRDESGRGPVPFWRATPDVVDTRLIPGRPDEAAFEFVRAPAVVRARVLHRRFWAEVAAAKGWPDRDLVVIDHQVSAASE
jgi:hypothetical protein